MVEKIKEITKGIADGKYSTDDANVILFDLFKTNDEMVNLIRWLSSCPYLIDEDTVPRNGIDTTPEQVVGNMSIAYLMYLELKRLSGVKL